MTLVNEVKRQLTDHQQATKGLAAEFAKDNIRFNAICPVVAETAM